MKYANEGGNLLVTGPGNHDEHWRTIARAAELKLDAQTEPLTYHNATIQLNNRVLTISFDQQKQAWLESLRFKDGSTLKEIPYGKGRIFWAAYPVELAEGTQSAADLYAYITNRLGIGPMFDMQSLLPHGVLVYPIELQDSVLYVLVSDSADDARIDLRDKVTGGHLTLQLASQHAALAVVGKKEKRVIAKYGF